MEPTDWRRFALLVALASFAQLLSFHLNRRRIFHPAILFVVAELWRREPVSFVGALVGPDPLSPVTNAALAQIDVSDLMRGISRDPSTAPEIAKRRGDLLLAEGFWMVPGIDIERTIASCEACRSSGASPRSP